MSDKTKGPEIPTPEDNQVALRRVSRAFRDARGLRARGDMRAVLWLGDVGALDPERYVISPDLADMLVSAVDSLVAAARDAEREAEQNLRVTSRTITQAMRHPRL